MTSPIAMAAQFALLTTAAVALSAPPAAAQAGPIQAGKGSKAPIDIVADQAEFFNIECRYVYTGSVEALQDTARLRSGSEAAAKARGVSVDQILAERAATVPAKRIGTADEFGATCAFLCSSHASFITGQNLLMDGGIFPGAF